VLWQLQQRHQLAGVMMMVQGTCVSAEVATILQDMFVKVVVQMTLRIMCVMGVVQMIR
jgi:hypothetical protein